MLADRFMKMVKPGWHVLIPPKSTRYTTPQSKGPYLSLYQLDNGAIHGLLVAASCFFEEIEGHEREWAEAALPSDFPTVPSDHDVYDQHVMQCRNGKTKSANSSPRFRTHGSRLSIWYRSFVDRERFSWEIQVTV